jgi:hypothetical protein
MLIATKFVFSLAIKEIVLITAFRLDLQQRARLVLYRDTDTLGRRLL